MKSKITTKSTGKMQYGDDGIAFQIIWLLIGILSGFTLYHFLLRASDTHNSLGFILLSFFVLILCISILFGHEKVTIFDKEKYRIVQRVAGYLSIRRYLYKPRIWGVNELRSVIIEELDDGEALFYSLSLRTISGEIIPLSNATMYASYDAREDAEKILSFLGLPIDNIQEEKRKGYELWKS